MQWSDRSGLQDAYIRQVPVLAGVVEAVADDELGADLEADVANVQLDTLDPLLHEEGGHFERFGLADPEALEEVVAGQARVDDVFDDQDVTPLEFIAGVFGEI